jgi:hypothetical protein
VASLRKILAVRTKKLDKANNEIAKLNTRTTALEIQINGILNRLGAFDFNNFYYDVADVIEQLEYNKQESNNG